MNRGDNTLMIEMVFLTAFQIKQTSYLIVNSLNREIISLEVIKKLITSFVLLRL